MMTEANNSSNQLGVSDMTKITAWEILYLHNNMYLEIAIFILFIF